jgi:acyl-coenzyme A synthetase/AMP-(fatty) acid ligase
MQKIYIKDDVFWAASDVGWVVAQLYRLWSFNQ